MHVRRVLTALLVSALSFVGSVAAWAATDPYRPQQWNLERVETPLAWEVSRGEAIRIAIVDTGVDLEHPDLMDRIARRADGSVIGKDYIDEDGDPSDENGHGTLVAGIAVATVGNGVGIAGIAPAARIMPIRVLDADGSGDGNDVDAAIRWAVDNGAHVVNLSLESVGTTPGIQLPIAAPTSAVRYAWDRGVVVVAAAGNDSSRSDDYPADSPVVLVGATTREDTRASFSDTGREDALMAPGVDIISTWWCRPGTAGCVDEHTYGASDGTSFAAPHVTGALAILRAAGFDHATAVARLRETARDIGAPGPDSDTGHGLIDIAAAAGARNPPPPPSPTPTSSPTTGVRPSGPTPSPVTTPGEATTPPATTSPTTPSPTATTPGSPDPTSPSPDGSTPDDRSSGPPTPATGDGDAPLPPTAAEDGPTRDRGPFRVVALLLLTIAIFAHLAVRDGS